MEKLPHACSPVDYPALVQEVRRKHPDLWEQRDTKRLLGKAFQLSRGKADPIVLQVDILAAIKEEMGRQGRE